LAAAVIVVLALGGGFLLIKGIGGGKHGNHGHHDGGIAPPACSSASNLGKTLASTQSHLADVGESPSAVAASPDGHWLFVTTPGSSARAGRVIAMQLGPAQTLTMKRSYQLSGSARGEALTSDGRYLLVATAAGVVVLTVHTFETGAPGAQVGTFTMPKSTGRGGALDVALSGDDKYLFVQPSHGSSIAVFNFGKAMRLHRPSITDLVGNIRLGLQPTGMALSPDGRSLYVTSSPAAGTNAAGRLSVLDVRTAEVHPLDAAVATAGAGCSPSGVIAAQDGKVVWVTAGGSNSLLAFSAANLRADPKHALTAAIQVGPHPTDLITIHGGDRLIVADSGTQSTGTAKNFLSVVRIAPARADKATLLGSIPTGLSPQDFVLAGTETLLVADSGSNQIQLVDLTTLR